MAGGIGDFSVSAGKPGTSDGAGAAASAPSSRTIRIPGGIPQGARTHFILLGAGEGAAQEPIRFHNGLLDDLKTRFSLTTRVPLPDMPGFFPAGSAGEMRFQGRHVFHLDAALREQPLFSHLVALRALVQKVADRLLAFPDFLPEINRIPIPPTWRNEIVNGLFDHAQSGPAAPSAPKTQVGQDLERIMGMFQEGDGGGTALNPNLGRFLDEVGRDSTGFTLRDGAAKELLEDLSRTLDTLRHGMLRHGPLAATLGLLASLQRLARLAKGREKQTVHLWPDIPSDPAAVLAADSDGAFPDLALALVLLDPLERSPAFLGRAAALAASLGAPLLVQLPDESIPADHPAVAALAAGVPAQTYFFAGGVASRVDGDACVFRPAALAFLEGLVAARQGVDTYLHRAMILEDQDIVTEKGQARAADKLLDQGRIDALAGQRVNRVNGVRNRTEAVFPLLHPWKDQ